MPGDLSVTPTRVVFEGRDRSAQVMLVNRASRTATFRILFVQMRMSGSGERVEIDAAGPGERFADPLVRFAPRQVKLEPGVAQTVRLMLRKPADLEPGEYRSHLLFRAVPEPDAGLRVDAHDDDGLAIQLRPIYGVSIPVIARQGDLSARVALDGLEWTPEAGGRQGLELRLSRSGDRSVYGDLAVLHRSAEGDDTVLALARGLAVYPPNAERRLRLDLTPPPGLDLDRGQLRVEFRESPETPGAVSASVRIDGP